MDNLMDHRSRGIYTATVNTKTLIDTSKFKLDVPEYQREYEWQKAHVGKMIMDILNLNSTNPKDMPVFFLGNIVLNIFNIQECSQDPNGASILDHADWPAHIRTAAICEIIDGQQRLTTICLLYAVMHDMLLEDARACRHFTAVDKALHEHAQTIKRLFIASSRGDGRYIGLEPRVKHPDQFREVCRCAGSLTTYLEDT